MELHNYWLIFLRRWPLLFLPVLLVGGYLAATYQPPSTSYNVGVRFLVAQSPSSSAQNEDEERYYNWLASEYIVNGLADWVRGNKFAQTVSERLAEQGVIVPAHEIGIAADNVRSMLQISVAHPDPVKLEAMINTIIELLQNENGQALPQLQGQPAVLQLLDTPVITPISAGVTAQAAVPLRLALALAAGLLLALAVDYFDPRIHGRAELERLELPLLGEIPKAK
jgi:capsular polysaccharide biosynthesis protein